MKQQLIEAARTAFRLLPLTPTLKKKIQHLCFSRLGFLFRHLPGYQMWSLQHPTRAREEVERLNLPQLREELLKTETFVANTQCAILMVTHSLGGGTEHHVKQLSDKLKAENIRVFVLRSLADQWVRLMPYDETKNEALIYHIEQDEALLFEQLRQYHLQLVHVHHTVDFPEGFHHFTQKMAEELHVPYDFTAHDYFAICPRYTLYDDVVRGYCGEPDVKRCQGCVKTYGSAMGKEVRMQTWRKEWAEFLSQARYVYTPDLDVKNRLEQYLPDARIVNRPHWDETPITPILKAPKQAGEPLRILTLGGIAPHKGSMVLYECAEDAKKRNLPIEFTLIGYSDIDWKLKKYMTVTGPYKNKELPALIREGNYDAVFLPAVWPETFNYTLSEILHFGLFPIAFEIGAIARRITEMGYGHVLPYEIYRDAQDINDAISALDIPQEIPVEKIQSAQKKYSNIMQEYYQLDEAPNGK